MKPARENNFIQKFMWVLNVLAFAGLLFSILAEYISPVHVWWLAIFGLLFSFFFLLNLVFVIYWLIVGKKKYLLSLILVIAGLGKLPGIYQLRPKSSSAKIITTDTSAFKIMSFNVRLFDLYNWFHNTQTRRKIFHFLQEESPDVICFQEFYSSDKKPRNFKNDIALNEVLQAGYRHVEYTVTLHDSDHWGIATYSRFPIINRRAVHFQKHGGNIFIYSDIVFGKDTIRVFNTHLESVRFLREDYKFIQNLGNDDVEQDEMKGSLNIIRRLRRAFIKRAVQVEVLHDTMNASPYPVILCGDFNDTPTSYTYHILHDDLHDAFRESGHGWGKTYRGPFPSFRIDYIFHSSGMYSSNFRTIHEELSEHFPVSCELRLEKPK